MAIKDVEKFYMRIESDKNLQDLIKHIDGEKKDVPNSKNIISFIKEVVIPLGKTLGFNFTVQELLIYETKILHLHYKYVTDEDTEDINGGDSKRQPRSLSNFFKNFNLDNNWE